MRRLNVCVTAILLVGLLFTGVSSSQAARNDWMSKSEFADVLVRILGLEMPENADQLSEAEVFEVQSNMLAESGISIFVDAKADDFVTLGDFANVLYDALIGPNEASLEDKINYLGTEGYIAIGRRSGPDSQMKAEDILSALNTPELSEAVAEGYRRIGGIGAVVVLDRTIAPSPHNVESESPASP